MHMRLQFFGAIELAQIAVECAERQMTGLSGDFEKEAIGEAERWSRPEDTTRTCLGSSRARMRTRTFVSTARMFLSDVLPDSVLQLFQCARLR
jgi:hypothetical protein